MPYFQFGVPERVDGPGNHLVHGGRQPALMDDQQIHIGPQAKLSAPVPSQSYHCHIVMFTFTGRLFEPCPDEQGVHESVHQVRISFRCAEPRLRTKVFLDQGLSSLEEVSNRLT
jgi:hypothetical protein